MNTALIHRCTFCSQESTSYKLFDTEVLQVVLSVPQSQRGHLVVVPKEHVSDLFTLESYEKFFSTVYELSRALRTSMGSDRVGIAAGITESGHGYLHLIPINSADDFLVNKELHLDQEELSVLCDTLRDSLSTFSTTS